MQLDWKSTTHALGARAKYAGRMAKLTMALSAEQEAIQSTLLEIGRVYYETRRDDSDPLLSQLCEEVRAAKARITDMQDELAAMHDAIHTEG